MGRMFASQATLDNLGTKRHCAAGVICPLNQEKS